MQPCVYAGFMRYMKGPDVSLGNLHLHCHSHWIKTKGAACRIRRAAMGVNGRAVVAFSAAWLGQMVLADAGGARRLPHALAFRACS